MGDGAHDEVEGAESPAITGTPSGGWTVVGPDGRVRTFSNRDDVLASLAASNEVTAAPPEVALGPRRLSLLPEEDPPPLPSKARRRKSIEGTSTSDPPAVAGSAEEVASTEPVAAISEPPPSLGEPLESSDDVLAVGPNPAPSTVDSIHSVDMLPTDSADALEESGPTSSDLQPEPSRRPPPVVEKTVAVSARPPPFKELRSKGLPNQDELNEGELVSLRDLVVVNAIGEGPSISTRSSSVPPPPKAGALRTLPPPRRSLAPAPPPPTITVASSPPPPVEQAPSAPPVAAKTRPSRAVTEASVPTPTAEAKRGWLMPVAVCAVLAAVVAYATRGPTTPGPVTLTATAESTGAPPPSGTSAATASATTTATPGPSGMPASSASVGLAPPASASAAGGTGVGASGSAPRGGVLTEVDSQLALSEVLSRAGAARRGGDQARAKALYERALQLSGGNVEAHAGLAEVARAQGDLAGAKASYERALAASPSYAPALLGLADVQWDQGDHEGAQRHYRELLGSHASIPERAKERAAGGATAAPSAAPAPTTAPAPGE